MTVKQVYILTSTQPPIQGDERIYGLIGLGETRAMPDLPLCLGVLNTGLPWARVGASSFKVFFTVDFCCCGASLLQTQCTCLTQSSEVDILMLVDINNVSIYSCWSI
jgi:hypothetical protein